MKPTWYRDPRVVWLVLQAYRGYNVPINRPNGKVTSELGFQLEDGRLVDVREMYSWLRQHRAGYITGPHTRWSYKGIYEILNDAGIDHTHQAVPRIYSDQNDAFEVDTVLRGWMSPETAQAVADAPSLLQKIRRDYSGLTSELALRFVLQDGTALSEDEYLMQLPPKINRKELRHILVERLPADLLSGEEVIIAAKRSARAA